MHRNSDRDGAKNDVNCADYKFVYMGPKGNLKMHKLNIS